MKRSLSPLQSRLLAVALLFAVIGAAWYAIHLVNQRWHQHYDSAIERSLDHLGRYQRIIGMRKGLEDAIAAVKAQDARRFYLKNIGPALAAAEVQQTVQAIVEAHGLKMEGTHIAPHKDADGVRKITIGFSLRGKPNDLQSVIYALEASVPWLYVDSALFRTTVGRAFVPTPGVEPEVTVGLELHGFAPLPRPGGDNRQGGGK